MKEIKTIFAILCAVAATCMGCSVQPHAFGKQANENNQESGAVRVLFAADGLSSFGEYASLATVTVSANDMDEMVLPLTVTKTGISGTITGIPAGLNRLFEVDVYNSVGVLTYYGNATGEIIAGSNINLSITLYPAGALASSGSATINGTIASGIVVYRINAGGIDAVSPYSQDQYYNGGDAHTFTDAVIIENIANAAPEAVYQSERFGNATYTLPSLIAGKNYIVPVPEWITI